MNLKPKEMLVVSPPYELHFVGPFNTPRVTLLKMKNPNDETMLFKIKTTAPKRYCVRPNFGAISPNEISTVEICLQPFNYDPREKNKHKFMVQSMVAPPTTEGDELNKLWKEAEQTGQLLDCKLRCVFEMPPELSAGNENNTAVTASVDNTKVNQSPRPTETALVKGGTDGSDDLKDLLEDQLKYLRDENFSLKKDNTKLKEQLSRLMVSPKKDPIDHPYTPQFGEKQIPMFYIAVAFAAAVFGLLMGKFLL